MAAPWIFLLIALVFFWGPFRRRSWRRGRWGNQMNEPWNHDRESVPADREKYHRLREEQIETLETRVTELESRLDYAERLMTQRRESESAGSLPPMH